MFCVHQHWVFFLPESAPANLACVKVKGVLSLAIQDSPSGCPSNDLCDLAAIVLKPVQHTVLARHCDHVLPLGFGAEVQR